MSFNSVKQRGSFHEDHADGVCREGKCLAVVIKSDLGEFCSQYHHKLP
jgi:hypothetical protein